MPVTATDTPTQVVISPSGPDGSPGTNGADGAGFNSVRKALIDNPLSWLYRKNNLVSVLKNTLTIERPTTAAYIDIYGNAQTALVDAPREEAEGWLITVDDTYYNIQVADNVPLLSDGFSVVLSIGSYAEAASSQNVFIVPGLSGDLLSVGTNSSGNWEAVLLGSDLLQYKATSSTSATSSALQSLVLTYSEGLINLYIGGILAATDTIATGITADMDLTGSVTTSGDFTVNMQGLRFYDFVLSADEITYLS